MGFSDSAYDKFVDEKGKTLGLSKVIRYCIKKII